MKPSCKTTYPKNLKTVKKLSAFIILSLLACSAANGQEQEPTSGTPVRSLVMSPGDYGSKFYRIPALTQHPDGTIILVADKRIEKFNDLPNKIDVVARRSTDGGRTWGPFITVAEHDSIGGFGDPAIVTDRRTGDILVISSHGNGLWNNSPSHTSISRSRDGGITWEAPVDISSQIFTTDPDGPQPRKLTAAFATSGRALQLRDGRIIFALVTRREGTDPFPCYAIYSDDGGHTWHASRTTATDDGDESKIAELPDGTLMMSIRSRFGKTRKFSVSEDRGETWTELPDHNNLTDIHCNGDFLSVNYKGKDYLLQSLPAGPDRRDITVYASEDGGLTWPYSHRITEGPGAYSTMLPMPDGETIGIASEVGCHEADISWAYRIWFQTFPLSALFKTEK